MTDHSIDEPDWTAGPVMAICTLLSAAGVVTAALHFDASARRMTGEAALESEVARTMIADFERQGASSARPLPSLRSIDPVQAVDAFGPVEATTLFVSEAEVEFEPKPDPVAPADPAADGDTSDAPQEVDGDRTRTGSTGKRTREIAVEVAREELRRLTSAPPVQGYGAGAQAYGVAPSGGAEDRWSAAPSETSERVSAQADASGAAPLRQVGAGRVSADATVDSDQGNAPTSQAADLSSDDVSLERDRLGGTELLPDTEGRRVLFVWDGQIVLDPERRRELLEFTARSGFDTLAIEATVVGYGDAARTDGFAALVEQAKELDLETFGLIGYPWFAVAPDAGLPGQPTSSREGLAVLQTLVDTGLFDGFVDDSHSYGVEYVEGGETRNYLFDRPRAASQDLQAWLRNAKGVAGDLPFVKTTPFWFDSHPDLLSVVGDKGLEYESLAHLVAAEVDTTIVLAYRDTLYGPNGMLDLIAGELSAGETIVAIETVDLGPNLDYLTFHEEGYLGVKEILSEVELALGRVTTFGGLSVHHYRPLRAAADVVTERQSFGFVGDEGIRLSGDALVDAYDSSIGRYYDQMQFAAEVGVVAGRGDGAIIANGTVELDAGALVFGDIFPGGSEGSGSSGGSDGVTGADEAIITGSIDPLIAPATLPSVPEVQHGSSAKLKVSRGRQAIVEGDQAYRTLSLSSYGSMYIVGPADVVVDELRLSSNSWIYADTTNGPVTLTVNRTLTLAQNAWIAPTSLQARDLTMRFAGEDDITLATDARLLTDLLAPKARIDVGRSAELYGRARARSIDVDDEGALHLDVSLPRD